mmetsp:Transcript_18969/g.44460  ORF Transcript_18969/g.44460 Transcript_18969/m.44460 type:complete len:504 (+) Transcript_18969:17-1528(+)
MGCPTRSFDPEETEMISAAANVGDDVLLEDDEDDDSIDRSYVIGLVLHLVQQQRGTTSMAAVPHSEDCDGSGNLEPESDPQVDALCTLWDLTMRPAVCQLVAELHIVDILVTYVSSSEFSTRTQELALGVLGNLAWDQQLTADIARKPEFVHTCVRIVMTETEIGLLSEAVRLIAVAVAHTEAGRPFYEALDDSVVLNQILCIWFNTLNPELQERASSLIHTLIFYNDRLLAQFLSLHLVPIAVDLLASHFDHSAPSETGLEALLRIFEKLASSQLSLGQLQQGEDATLALLKVTKQSHNADATSAAIVVLANLGPSSCVGAWVASDWELVEMLVDAATSAAQEVRVATWWLLLWGLTRLSPPQPSESEPVAPSPPPLSTASQRVVLCLARRAAALTDCARDLLRQCVEPIEPKPGVSADDDGDNDSDNDNDEEDNEATAAVVVSCIKRLANILASHQDWTAEALEDDCDDFNEDDSQLDNVAVLDAARRHLDALLTALTTGL